MVYRLLQVVHSSNLLTIGFLPSSPPPITFPVPNLCYQGSPPKQTTYTQILSGSALRETQTKTHNLSFRYHNNYLWNNILQVRKLGPKQAGSLSRLQGLLWSDLSNSFIDEWYHTFSDDDIWLWWWWQWPNVCCEQIRSPWLTAIS